MTHERGVSMYMIAMETLLSFDIKPIILFCNIFLKCVMPLYMFNFKPYIRVIWKVLIGVYYVMYNLDKVMFQGFGYTWIYRTAGVYLAPYLNVLIYMLQGVTVKYVYIFSLFSSTY